MTVAQDCVSLRANFAAWRLCVGLFLLVLVVSSGAASAQTAASTAPLHRAAGYLWKQQAEDGGWHSGQYGVLRSGQALTPLVLDALLDVPESICPRPDGAVARALDFIRKHVDEQGALGHADADVAEYPVYSTSHALKCLLKVRDDPKLGQETDQRLAELMYSYLVAAQFTEGNGFATSDAAYGGWGLDAPREPGNPGHMDLAHSRRALAALRAFGPARGHSPFTRGELFLRVVQRHPKALAVPRLSARHGGQATHAPYDGGFFFSPIVEQANKGRTEPAVDGSHAPYFRSYATATCDGVLALLACGISRTDVRVVKAMEWLQAHEDFDYPEGVPRDHPEPWGEAIRFYHYAVRAEAYDALEWPGDWRTKLSAAVAKTQAAEGSFRNGASPLMKEDDPILCTALAIVALARCAK
jgi:hypothetical protein